MLLYSAVFVSLTRLSSLDLDMQKTLVLELKIPDSSSELGRQPVGTRRGVGRLGVGIRVKDPQASGVKRATFDPAHEVIDTGD